MPTNFENKLLFYGWLTMLITGMQNTPALTMSHIKVLYSVSFKVIVKSKLIILIFYGIEQFAAAITNDNDPTDGQNQVSPYIFFLLFHGDFNKKKKKDSL